MGSIMPRIADRFRGFLPVVIDVETGGFNASKDALLEIAACIIRMDDFGRLFIAETVAVNVDPFKEVRATGCQRAILVGHNSFFDLSFLNAAIARTDFKRSPLHPFSSFDTATLAGLAFGQTVLSRSVQAAGLDWNESEAHSAIYDTERTAALFCAIVNRWKILTGF